jgi:hypothetical protein
MYLRDGRVALYQIAHDGTRHSQPSYIELQ